MSLSGRIFLVGKNPRTCVRFSFGRGFVSTPNNPRETSRMTPSPHHFDQTISRLADVLAHTKRYSFKAPSRLSQDAGVHPASVFRILRGGGNPSFLTVTRITEAIERELGFRIDPRDLIAEGGRFPTPFCCDVTRSQPSLPDSAYDEFGDLKPAFAGIEPGKWVSSRHPRGVTSSSTNN